MVELLKRREQAVLRITISCEMTISSLLMPFSLLQTTYATRKNALTFRCVCVCVLHIVVFNSMNISLLCLSQVCKLHALGVDWYGTLSVSCLILERL
jgi:hypothetical protein